MKRWLIITHFCATQNTLEPSSNETDSLIDAISLVRLQREMIFNIVDRIELVDARKKIIVAEWIFRQQD